MPLHALFYDYVPDILERRAPHRAAHLELIRGYEADGRLLAAGALGNPPTGALFVFGRAADAERLPTEDPYVAAGLVTGVRVVPWTMVAGPWKD